VSLRESGLFSAPFGVFSGTFVYNHKTMRRILPLASLCMAISMGFAGKAPGTDPRLKGAYRVPPRNGRTFVHREGTPGEIGFQHGFPMARESKDGFDVMNLEAEQDMKKPPAPTRKTAGS
jgi:hypothetical protein